LILQPRPEKPLKVLANRKCCKYVLKP
jgi:hypothetical protein